MDASTDYLRHRYLGLVFTLQLLLTCLELFESLDPLREALHF